jgi:hypothetical protein
MLTGNDSSCFYTRHELSKYLCFKNKPDAVLIAVGGMADKTRLYLDVVRPQFSAKVCLNFFCLSIKRMRSQYIEDLFFQLICISGQSHPDTKMKSPIDFSSRF